jgi:hypothetical protein
MEFAQYMANLKPVKKPVSNDKPGVFHVEHSGHQLSGFVRITRKEK